VDWINLAQSGGKWWSFVVAVMNLVLHKMQRISRLAKELLASQENCAESTFWLTGWLITKVVS
jgi:hypothetical protein